MGSLLFLMKRGKPAPPEPRHRRTVDVASYVFLVLFCVLFVLALALGANGETGQGEAVGLAGVFCIIAMVGLYACRDHEQILQWGVFFAAYAALALVGAVGYLLSAQLMDIEGPLALSGVVTVLGLTGFLFLGVLVLRAKYDPRLSDGTEPVDR